MPINSLSRIVLACACFTLAPAFAFDGTRTPSDMKPAVPQVSPREAFVSGAQSLRAGEKEKGLSSLQYAAEQGHAMAQWKLGRMYAAGDGVPRSDQRAFDYFSRIADTHAEDNPNVPQARFVANAFVQLGNYYLKGIPGSDVKADPDRAREMYTYAASYFGDADAQYSLARLYLDGIGAPRDTRQAVRWLSLAANKGQARAQAMLGNVLFKGESGGPRQAALGLMWLTLARDNAAAEDGWVAEMHQAAFNKATDDERQLALVFLERWLKNRRD
jgi:TPR repeat protein